MDTLGKIQKSQGDPNNYSCFKLANGLVVLLIDDKTQDFTGDEMAYAALSVNVGSFNDPMHRQGLAHLLEHMIFRGSRKYTDVKAYSEHLSEHGGYYNANTQFEKTTY